MSLNRLACYTPFSRLASTGIRMASAIVGKSGRVYVQGEVLQHHREDHKFSVFKAEYVSHAMIFSQLRHISDPSHSGPKMSLLSSNAYLGCFTIDLFALQPSLQAHVGFECIPIATKKIVF